MLILFHQKHTVEWPNDDYASYDDYLLKLNKAMAVGFDGKCSKSDEKAARSVTTSLIAFNTLCNIDYVMLSACHITMQVGLNFAKLLVIQYYNIILGTLEKEINFSFGNKTTTNGACGVTFRNEYYLFGGGLLFDGKPTDYRQVK